ncbi:MAG: hypothetical protein ACYTHM_14340, partial [Planctomycetota bacterium]|jgi:hypothetical protein
VNSEIVKTKNQIRVSPRGVHCLRGKSDLYDQKPVAKRIGLERCLQGLTEALAKIRDPEACAWLLDNGWRRAAGADQLMGGAENRIALVDAASRIPGAGAFAFVRERCFHKDTCVRIAALEGLGRHWKEREGAIFETLSKVLREENPSCVTIPALKVLEKGRPGKAMAVLTEFLKDRMERENGGILREHVRRVVKKVHGDGTFGNLSETSGPRDVTFYGIPTASRKIIFLINLAYTLRKKVQPSRSRLDVLKEEIAGALRTMDAGVEFNLILYGPQLKACFPALVPATKENKSKALEMFAGIEREFGESYVSHDKGICEAYRMAGMDPAATRFEGQTADTVYLLTDGSIFGGTYMTPEAMVDAVKRLNRFRNMAIHTIQIGDFGPESETLVRGLAKATGGNHIWRKE